MLKDIIKSVKIVESQWEDEVYDVIIELHQEAADSLFKKINDSLEEKPSKDLIEVHPCLGMNVMVPTLEFGKHSFWIVDYDDSWYVLEMVNAPWTRVSVVMEGDNVCTMNIGFNKVKEGLDAFDYTDYKGIPENAWIEPLKLIRNIFQ